MNLLNNLNENSKTIIELQREINSQSNKLQQSKQQSNEFKNENEMLNKQIINLKDTLKQKDLELESLFKEVKELKNVNGILEINFLKINSQFSELQRNIEMERIRMSKEKEQFEYNLNNEYMKRYKEIEKSSVSENKNSYLKIQDRDFTISKLRKELEQIQKKYNDEKDKSGVKNYEYLLVKQTESS